MLLGKVDAGEVLDSLSTAQFAKIVAFNRVVPVSHEKKMLGHIAYWLAKFVGVEIEDRDLRELCLPWYPAVEPLNTKPTELPLL